MTNNMSSSTSVGTILNWIGSNDIELDLGHHVIASLISELGPSQSNLDFTLAITEEYRDNGFYGVHTPSYVDQEMLWIASKILESPEDAARTSATSLLLQLLDIRADSGFTQYPCLAGYFESFPSLQVRCPLRNRLRLLRNTLVKASASGHFGKQHYRSIVPESGELEQVELETRDVLLEFSAVRYWFPGTGPKGINRALARLAEWPGWEG